MIAIEDIFQACIAEPNSGCLIWAGRLNKDGYPYFGGAIIVILHRYVYEKAIAPIPDGLEIDHLCRVRCCVNPRHMEPVTRAENCRRGLVSRPWGEWRARDANGGWLPSFTRYQQHDLLDLIEDLPSSLSWLPASVERWKDSMREKAEVNPFYRNLQELGFIPT